MKQDFETGELKAELGNGKLLVINGPASLPIAMFLAHNNSLQKIGLGIVL